MAEAAALSTMHGATAASSTSDDSKELRYYYLDKRVKGESVRLALFVGGIEFEDVRLTYHEVQEMRVSGKLPFSQVPALQIGSGDDAPIYAQSQALLRWAGRKGGLYPEKHQLLIDAVTDVMVELYTEMIKVGYGSAMTRNPISGRPMVQLSQNQRKKEKKKRRESIADDSVTSAGETGSHSSLKAGPIGSRRHGATTAAARVGSSDPSRARAPLVYSGPNHHAGSSDPCAFLNLDGEKRKSRVVKKSINPQWMQTFRFPCDDGLNVTLQVDVEDYDLKGNDFMGRVSAF